MQNVTFKIQTDTKLNVMQKLMLHAQNTPRKSLAMIFIKMWPVTLAKVNCPKISAFHITFDVKNLSP
jgi:hypothetical protein